MGKLEDLEKGSYLVHDSMISLNIDNNKILRTILDVLVQNHLDSKTKEEDKAKFEDWLIARLNENTEAAVENMVLAPEKKEV